MCGVQDLGTLVTKGAVEFVQKNPIKIGAYVAGLAVLFLAKGFEPSKEVRASWRLLYHHSYRFTWLCVTGMDKFCEERPKRRRD